MHYDILISGAGPAGLCLARALSGHGLTIAVIEQQPLAALQGAGYDGREIALTQRSSRMLQDLGVWARIEALQPHAFSALRDAQVQSGPSPFALRVEARHAQRSELGWLVSNHWIRRAVLQAVQDCTDVSLIAGDGVVQAHTEASHAHVRLASGRTLQARLLVAADSRFSSTRRAMGIAASMHDFGRSMLLCTMQHEVPHDHIAWEWFGYGQTLALLPMNPDPRSGAHRSCVVLTVPHATAEQLHGLPPDAFNENLTQRFSHRLGAMRLVPYSAEDQATRHLYPLVGVRPHRLVAPHFACVGDAAIGMHPVTAHGFNLGLQGIDTLSQAMLQAHTAGRDIASAQVLSHYERQHQRTSVPLYLATQTIARLYTDDRAPARLLRGAALRLAQGFAPFRQAVAHSLAG